MSRKVRKMHLPLSRAFSLLRTWSVFAGDLAAWHGPCHTSGMLFFLLAQAFSLLLDLIWLGHRAKYDKDVEILLLRQQLRMLQRKQSHPPRVHREAAAGARFCGTTRTRCLPVTSSPLKRPG